MRSAAGYFWRVRERVLDFVLIATTRAVVATAATW